MSVYLFELEVTIIDETIITLLNSDICKNIALLNNKSMGAYSFDINGSKTNYNVK